MNDAQKRAQHYQPLFAEAAERDWQHLAEKHQALDVLSRVQRVRKSLLEFVAEGRVLHDLERVVAGAMADERSRLERFADMMRIAFYDTKRFCRPENPDISPEEAAEIVAWIRALEPKARLRAAMHVHSIAQVRFSDSAARAISRSFDALLVEAKKDVDGADSPEFVNQVMLERRFYDQFEKSRSPQSDGRESISDRECRDLLLLVKQMALQRGQMFLDALAAMSLQSISFAPSQANSSAMVGAQNRIAELFWQREAASH